MIPFFREIKSPKMPKDYTGMTTPRPPTAEELVFVTTHYPVKTARKAEPLVKDIERVAFTKDHNWSSYDEYVVVDDKSINSLNFDALVPKKGVRLSDRLIGIALQLPYKAAELSWNWPADFNGLGMVHADRMPIGTPFKVLICRKTIEKGRKGHVDFPSKYIYGWVGGIHQLCGKDGLEEENVFQVRCMYEELAYQGIGPPRTEWEKRASSSSA